MGGGGGNQTFLAGPWIGVGGTKHFLHICGGRESQIPQNAAFHVSNTVSLQNPLLAPDCVFQFEYKTMSSIQLRRRILQDSGSHEAGGIQIHIAG